MATKAELEELVDNLETRIERLQEEAVELIEAVRAEHDAKHSEPWTICRSGVCRHAEELQGQHEYLQMLAG
jgi:NTP pyrophosphatase (non-canonical NTP hydrolase)